MKVGHDLDLEIFLEKLILESVHHRHHICDVFHDPK